MVKTNDKTHLKLSVMNFIREQIKTHGFKPGEHIKELYLTEVLGVSRAPVREALLELSAEGLVRLDPNRGAYVTELSQEEIMERILLCGALEGFALSRTMHLLTPVDFQHLEASVKRMIKIAETTADVSKLLQEDLHFHHLCVARVKDAFLHEFIEKCSRILEVLLAKYWALAYTSEDFVRRHQELYAALTTKDAVYVEQTVRAHYLETAQRMSRYGSASSSF